VPELMETVNVYSPATKSVPRESDPDTNAIRSSIFRRFSQRHQENKGACIAPESLSGNVGQNDQSA
jgi:hypothetical protein